MNDVVDRRRREFEIDRHGNEAGAHDAVDSREVLEAIGREDGNAVAARQAAACERACDRIGLRFEIAVAEAARLTRAKIDDRDLVGIAIL